MIHNIKFIIQNISDSSMDTPLEVNDDSANKIGTVHVSKGEGKLIYAFNISFNDKDIPITAESRTLASGGVIEYDDSKEIGDQPARVVSWRK